MSNIIQNITEITNIISCSQEYYNRQNNPEATEPIFDPYYETTLYITTDTNNFYYGSRKLSDTFVVDSYPDSPQYPDDKIYLYKEKDSIGYKVYFKHDNIVTLIDMTGQYIDVDYVTDLEDPVIVEKTEDFVVEDYRSQRRYECELSHPIYNYLYNRPIVKFDEQTVPGSCYHYDYTDPTNAVVDIYLFESPITQSEFFEGDGTTSKFVLNDGYPMSGTGISAEVDGVSSVVDSYIPSENAVWLLNAPADGSTVKITYTPAVQNITITYKYALDGVWQLSFHLDSGDTEVRTVVALGSNGQLSEYIYDQMYDPLREFVEENYVTPRWNVKGSGGSNPYQIMVEEAMDEIIGEVNIDE